MSNWTGAKYVHNRDLADIAKDVRADIAAAIKAATLPAGLKVSVRLSRYSMGQSLTIKILSVPKEFLVLRVKRVAQEMVRRPGTPVPYYTVAAANLVKALEAIANAYNYDKSDTACDYHNVAFYLSVDFDSAITQAQRADIEATLRAAYAGAVA